MAMKEKPSLNFAGLDADEVIELMNKTFGPNTAILASKAIPIVEAYSSRVYAFDFATRIGGFPKRRLTMLVGNYSTFKSTLALLGLVSMQRAVKDGYGIYIDLERTFDSSYARRLGVDVDRVILINPDSGEQAVDTLRSVCTWDRELFAIVDSIANMVPTAEMESSAEQNMMGVQARLINRFMRILIGRMKACMYDRTAPSITVVAINQLREKVGIMFGNPETTPGGKGKDFSASMIVRMSTSASKDNTIGEDVTRNGVKMKVRYGQHVEFKIQKNKCGGPQGAEGAFRYFEREFDGYAPCTVDNPVALFQYGAFHDVIRVVGDKYEYGNIRAGSEAHFIKKLRAAEAKERLRLRREILDAMRDAA